jgi:uncharacterized protein
MSREEELLHFMLGQLVDEPAEVQVTVVEGEKSTILEVRATPDDVGKIIGKQGRIIKALRTIMNAAATRSGKRIMLEILDRPGKQTEPEANPV